jgi:hypothetical protein
VGAVVPAPHPLSPSLPRSLPPCLPPTPFVCCSPRDRCSHFLAPSRPSTPTLPPLPHDRAFGEPLPPELLQALVEIAPDYPLRYPRFRLSVVTRVAEDDVEPGVRTPILEVSAAPRWVSP